MNSRTISNDIDIEIGEKPKITTQPSIIHDNVSIINNDQQKDILKMSCCIICCVVTITMPIIICDLYFGFSGEPCLLESSPQLNFKLKTYLLVSGFLGIIMIILYIVATYFMINMMDKNSDKNLISVPMMVLGIGISVAQKFFIIIWTILGAVLFWDYVYPRHTCSSKLSSYLFASLIIKLISLSCVINNNKDNE